MVQNRKLHPNSAIERQNIPRKEGGRGIIDIVSLHERQIYVLRRYFHNRKEESALHKAVIRAEEGSTPLNLAVGMAERRPNRKKEELLAKLTMWGQKSMHGRYPADLNKETVDKKASLR
ncbi:hypothetical protein PGB90_006716 [Kerria lacca]